MSISTIGNADLHIALEDMTGATDVVEATFTPWDEDQAVELEALLRDLRGLEKLDAAIVAEAA